MNKLFFISLSILLIFYSCKKDSNIKKTQEKTTTEKVSNASSQQHFIKIPSSTSNLHFKNIILDTISTKSNLFDFDFFYNGAGVGIEDINNDGLKDIFFCGNQVPNKLYINKGNLIFEDISATANINTNKNWSNGVTFADVNNDGWMDIYISQGGPKDENSRNNLLLINQKDLTFKEKASEYGLDDAGISTQSAFFDFDKDGDLDCIVMNESEYYGLDPNTFYNILKDESKRNKSSSNLYQNTNGRFVNITKKAGLLQPSFGLGLCISDINNDGWLDIYIANDYYVPDALYINNKNNTFTDQIKEYTNHVSFYGMGVDIADINNDNLKDIFVLDMASSDHVRSKTLMASMNVKKFDLLINKLNLHNQYMFNSLQLNTGNNNFHNIAQHTGLSKTDWSWAGLVFDFNNDQNDDIYVTNGYRKYALDNDIRTLIYKAKKYYKGNVPLEVKKEIYNRLPSEKLSNILFKNNGGLNFENITSTTQLNELSFSNGAAYSDLDNDGDLEIVVNNIDGESFLYKNMSIENNQGSFLKINTTGSTSEDFAKVTLYYDDIVKTKESKRVRGYLSSIDKTIHFGLGKITSVDSVKVNWLSGKQETLYNIKANTTINVSEKNAVFKKKSEPKKQLISLKKTKTSIRFKHIENDYDDFENEILLPYKQSTLGPYIAKGDVNGDKKEDIYIGGASGQAGQLFIHSAQGFKKSNINIFTKDAKFEDMETLFFDFDSDGDNDIYVVSGGNEFKENSKYLKDRLYINDGNANFTKHPFSENNPSFSGKTITKIDFDKDGDLDLILGNRIISQKYPFPESSIIYENIDGTFKNVTKEIAPSFENFGIVNKVIATDFNNDGWQDFIAVGEWTSIGVFKNVQGKFTDISNKSSLENEKGWWFSITETDVNNDGNKDYIIGNVGLNFKFKATKQKPLRVYADDFDSNGTHDIVLSYKYKGNFVPARGRECSSQQMPFIAKKIPTYQEFANADLEKIYGNKINTAYQREANEFNSILLLNKGNDGFEKIVLPKMAQTIPILDSEPFDFNSDGYEDIIVVGTIYNTEVETPRLDNAFGLVLLSNKKNGYNVLGPDKTGFYIDGNAKSVELISKKNKEFLLVGMNNADIETFQLTSYTLPTEPKIP
ncbi:VCBS repeat-containing protein [Aquimarina sp. MMG016]|uniref:VCBS repeat-containing protein n=1 Tax=Aquimarina sp. MMG016 TaxID=2822690 RepID=UPI001B3A75F5|nr:VCBS repeat-containing protein [Aquimarina sp. MMG016]MBQ4821463.1 VCBS repeat-containing protein [Aquimarina sp. MMG016]